LLLHRYSSGISGVLRADFSLPKLTLLCLQPLVAANHLFTEMDLSKLKAKPIAGKKDEKK